MEKTYEAPSNEAPHIVLGYHQGRLVTYLLRIFILFGTGLSRETPTMFIWSSFRRGQGLSQEPYMHYMDFVDYFICIVAAIWNLFFLFYDFTFFAVVDKSGI